MKRRYTCDRTLAAVTLVLALALAVGRMGLAQIHGAHSPEDGERVREINSHDIREKLDGKDAAVTVVEVTIEPGKEGVPHRHPGPGLVYVLEGEYELGVDDQPTQRFHAGDTFYEPTGCLHRMSRNPSKTACTRLIAFVLHPRGVTEIAVPEPTQEAQGHELRPQ